MTAGPGVRPMQLPTAREHPFDPPAPLRDLAAQGPLHPLGFPDGHIGWVTTSRDLARAVLADQRFSARQDLRHLPFEHSLGEDPAAPMLPGMFLRLDPPDHTRYRRLLTAHFTVRRLNRLTPRIQQIADECLDAMEQAGSPADLVQHFSLPIPSLVICELLGVPYADRAEFQGTTETMVRLGTPKEEFMAAMNHLYGYFRRLVAAKRADPGDDLLSALVAGGDLTDEELTGVGLVLLIAGHETTANMIALGTYALLRHPDQLAALRADPTLIDNAVEELLRYLSIIQFGAQRTALEDVELEGVTVRKGQTVVISIPMANRDPGQFDDPDTLDLTRSATGHVGFGHGVHQCLGQQLARVEMRVAYAALFRRFPGLRLAVPEEELAMRTDMAIYGVHRLPVAFEPA
ncbi:cytochrome P450 [Nonomuraea sp. KC401]|uniref:cytochrome P450 n=1 Tax=unclassified Nonomuraea TaxID=2593643 RepID=UPI0010FD17BC|nr:MULTISPECIES: cytochrome P450 [unclassified Nonomuraea]NBE91695.1 cytochrome P450 [Nonomuraea sp. K271]TLF85847.1 cytochrome P450 [Nonomuraea sp. KC401]